MKEQVTNVSSAWEQNDHSLLIKIWKLLSSFHNFFIHAHVELVFSNKDLIADF